MRERASGAIAARRALSFLAVAAVLVLAGFFCQRLTAVTREAT